jgi:hypothetical protein
MGKLSGRYAWSAYLFVSLVKMLVLRIRVRLAVVFTTKKVSEINLLLYFRSGLIILDQNLVAWFPRPRMIPHLLL